MSSMLLSATIATGMPEETRHLHNHDCHQILYITRGRVKVCVSGREYTVGSGAIVIISCFEDHWIRPLDNQYERYILKIHPWFKMDGSTNYRIRSVLFNRPEGFHNYLDVSEKPSIYAAIFERLLQQKQYSMLRDEMCDLLLQELLIEICRQFPELFVHVDNEAVEIISHIQNQFETACDQQYSLRLLSRKYGISDSYLSHLFKRITGMSVMQYLLFCRLNTARKLLEETSISIGQVVEQCGFSDDSNFSRTFRKQIGMSPRQYRAIKARTITDE